MRVWYVFNMWRTAAAESILHFLWWTNQNCFLTPKLKNVVFLTKRNEVLNCILHIPILHAITRVIYVMLYVTVDVFDMWQTTASESVDTHERRCYELYRCHAAVEHHKVWLCQVRLSSGTLLSVSKPRSETWIVSWVPVHRTVWTQHGTGFYVNEQDFCQLQVYSKF